MAASAAITEDADATPSIDNSAFKLTTQAGPVSTPESTLVFKLPNQVLVINDPTGALAKRIRRHFR